MYASIAPKPLFGDDLVGLEHRIEEPKSVQDMKPNDDTVCMLGIYSISGIGKTEIAKALCRNIVQQFDDVEQLKILAGERDWFPGSRIITTRDEDLLIGHQVKKIYKIEELDDQHSLELFCQNVFGKIHPETGYEEGSSRVIGYSKGVPSELKVIVSDKANDKSLQAWECALEEYKWNLVGRIQDMLQRSLEIYTKTKLKLGVAQKHISKRLATTKDELSWKYQWHVHDKLLYVIENLRINI